MHGYKMVRRCRARVVVVLTLAVIGVLLVFVSSAVAGAPARVGFPLRNWSASKIEQGVAIDSQNRIVAVGGTAGGDSGLALTRVFR